MIYIDYGKGLKSKLTTDTKIFTVWSHLPTLIIHFNNGIFLHISILPFQKHSGLLWTLYTFAYSFSCLAHSTSQDSSRNHSFSEGHPDSPSYWHCLLFFHSATLSLSPLSDYRCLKQSDHEFPNASSVPNTKRHNKYIATSMLSTLSPWVPGLFPTPMPFL